MTMPKVAVIPVAGRGTRWMPVSRFVPKELLPVWRRTSASYAFEEAVSAGFEEIIFVISPDKHEVLDHFSNFDASDLGPQYSGESRNKLHSIVKVSSCVQEQSLGLGHAVLCAEEAVAGRSFGVLLPDEVLMTNGIGMLTASVPSVLLMEVSHEQCHNYGIVSAEKIDDALIVRDMVEKPALGKEPSTLAVTGRYIFTPEIFNYLREQAPGLHGEIQLTDAMNRYTREYPIHGVIYRGVRYDVGQPFGLLAASMDFALHDASAAPEMRRIMTDLLNNTK